MNIVTVIKQKIKHNAITLEEIDKLCSIHNIDKEILEECRAMHRAISVRGIVEQVEDPLDPDDNIEGFEDEHFDEEDPYEEDEYAGMFSVIIYMAVPADTADSYRESMETFLNKIGIDYNDGDIAYGPKSIENLFMPHSGRQIPENVADAIRSGQFAFLNIWGQNEEALDNIDDQSLHRAIIDFIGTNMPDAYVIHAEVEQAGI